MKPLFIAAALSLAALPALAQTSGSYIICIGEGACSMVTTQRCSVALGKNVQLPEGPAGDHVFVTRAGSRKLAAIDDVTVERVNGALAEYARLWRPGWKNARLDPEFIKEWNAQCGAPAIS